MPVEPPKKNDRRERYWTNKSVLTFAGGEDPIEAMTRSSRSLTLRWWIDSDGLIIDQPEAEIGPVGTFDHPRLKKSMERIGAESVFACVADSAQLVVLLGSEWRQRVEHLGAKLSYDPEAQLILSRRSIWAEPDSADPK